MSNFPALLLLSVLQTEYLNSTEFINSPDIEHTKEEIDRHVIPSDEFEQIIERSPADTPYYIPIIIGYHTGCRIGEAMKKKIPCAG
ncbi:hypothetical protein [Desulfosporosinus orientis]|uniref:hypothetical protein n=1 Tax=Desulfosporosinus orientis TaxID=1563 RepID=UPI0011D20DC0|nr:hypothetical protein [Desulfosporosinus orientis]